MTDVRAILSQRRSTHGDYTVNARVAQQAIEIWAREPSWYKLTHVQRETLWMIAHKVARILGGSPNHRDHWDDVAGYAVLTADRVDHEAHHPDRANSIGVQTSTTIFWGSEAGWDALNREQRKALTLFSVMIGLVLSGWAESDVVWQAIATAAKRASDSVKPPTVEELERILSVPEVGNFAIDSRGRVDITPIGGVIRPGDTVSYVVGASGGNSGMIGVVVSDDPNAPPAQSWGARADAIVAASRGIPDQSGTPEDGGHHAAASEDELKLQIDVRMQRPWLLSPITISAMPMPIGNLYHEHCRAYSYLEPSITSSQRLEISRVADGMSHGEGRMTVRDALNNYNQGHDGFYVLDVAHAPALYRDLWPRLRRELNSREHEESPLWQRGMYRRDEAALKWILLDEHVAWTGE